MPQNFEAHLKDVLVTCVGLLAGSLGVFVVRRLHISSVHLGFMFIRFIEYTECGYLATILPILASRTYLHWRGEDGSHPKIPASISQNPSSLRPPVGVG